MGKIKSFIISTAAVCCPFLICTSSAAGQIMQNAAYISAGAFVRESTDSESTAEPPASSIVDSKPASTGFVSSESSEPSDSSEDTENPGEPTAVLGKIITRNRVDYTDDTDYSRFNTHSGMVMRYAFGKYNGNNYVNLEGGAQVQNLTDHTIEELFAASQLLPTLGSFDNAAEEPQVLIYHTHTTESFYPDTDWYDADYPTASLDDERNITAVGDAICNALSKRGISVIHDCTVHDYPQYTGSYYRSADTVNAVLEEYPSVKFVLDIHRDGIADYDGTPIAPAIEINGRSAAQFMIITGCDNGILYIPDYIENFKAACLIQRCAESAYPGLARAVLFDYRNYNQDISNGSLLIEVGSQANTLDEAIYTGELLGNIIADAIAELQ